MIDNSTKSLEIDFHYVDSGEKSGDAISLRYGNFNDASQQYVVIIDGGTLETGKNLVEHVKNIYNTSYVDLVVCTHPDGDHVSGLREVLKGLTVGKLWMHKPWEHSEDIRDFFLDGRLTANSLSKKLQDAYGFAYDLEQIAIEKSIEIVEPFAGLTFGNEITVLGPSMDYYQSLLPESAKTPLAKGFVSESLKQFSSAINWVREAFNIETLDESGITTAENNSSCVLLLNFDGQKCLFTGDAGIQALNNVIDHSNELGIDLTTLQFLQVPHHGSKRNVSPSILDKIKASTAYISASKDNEKHPSKKVTNALIRRGSSVYTTEGKSILYRRNTPRRPNYGPLQAYEFSEQVQE